MVFAYFFLDLNVPKGNNLQSEDFVKINLYTYIAAQSLKA